MDVPESLALTARRLDSEAGIYGHTLYDFCNEIVRPGLVSKQLCGAAHPWNGVRYCVSSCSSSL